MRRSITSLFSLFVLSLSYTCSCFGENHYDLLVTALNDPQKSQLSQVNEVTHNSILELFRKNRTYTETYKRIGDNFKFYKASDLEFSCLQDQTCFWRSVGFITNAHAKEFLPMNYVPSNEDLAYIEDVLSKDKLESEIESKLDQFKKRIKEISKIEKHGPSNASKKVWVFWTGHPLERIQEETINRLLREFPKDFQFSIVKKKDYPEMFEIIGERWHSAILYEDLLIKDFYTFDQWMEFFFERLPKNGEVFAKIPIFDSHEHVRSSGHEKFLEIIADNNISRGLVAALPQGINYEELDLENEGVLQLTNAHKDKLLGFVMLSPKDSSALMRFSKLIELGARGLKLMNGHGDYFSKGGENVIDPPAFREVFSYCERKGIPILWHVNSHLFYSGFLRVLKEYPKLKIINPHLAGYLTSAPGIVRQLLKEYPNLYIDISFGVRPDYLRRSLEDISFRSKEWREVFLEFSDRFLFGIDMVITNETSRAHAKMLYELYRSLLEKKKYDFHFFQARGYTLLYELSHCHDGLNGLDLPENILRKIYWENPISIFGK